MEKVVFQFFVNTQNFPCLNMNINIYLKARALCSSYCQDFVEGLTLNMHNNQNLILENRTNEFPWFLSAGTECSWWSKCVTQCPWELFPFSSSGRIDVWEWIWCSCTLILTSPPLLAAWTACLLPQNECLRNSSSCDLPGMLHRGSGGPAGVSGVVCVCSLQTRGGSWWSQTRWSRTESSSSLTTWTPTTLLPSGQSRAGGTACLGQR